MSYQVLARKWRPQDFTEVAVQIPTIQVLQNSLDSQKLHHAYLFTGTRGVGKTTIARILAKALICEQGISSQPCNNCFFCKAVTDGNCVDVIEIDAASKTKVEDTRLILDNLAYAPSAARFKIYIIDEVHMLSTHSFNALLKSLEEPPTHVKFLLATTDPQKLPITVLSRCLQFKLKMFSSAAITKQLEHILTMENKLFEQDAILQIALAANGSMRDALSLLEQVLAFSEHTEKITKLEVCSTLGIPDSLQLINLLTAVLKSDLALILVIINNFAEANLDLTIILQEILVMLKNVTILQIAPNALLQEETILHKDLLLNLANITTKEEIQLYYDIAINGFKNLAFTPDPKVWFEMIMLRMAAFVPVTTKPIEAKDLTVPVTITKDQNLVIKDPKTTENKSQLNFYEIINQLNISGLTKELAENAVFESMTDNKIKLIIDENKKLLITKYNIENLQSAFNKHFAKDISLKVELQNFRENQALTKATVRFQKQLELQNFINNDQDLQQLITSFDGQIELVE